MAKVSKKESYTKCVIDIADGTITEYLKDTTNVYKIQDLLDRWNGVNGVSISISTDEEISTIED